MIVSKPKMLALLAVAFVAGSFVASPELRASAAATITSADIVDGTIKSVDIGAGEVKTSDIGNGHVTSAKIKDGNVMTSDLANGAVTSDKLAAGAVTLEKLGTGVAEGLDGEDGVNGTNGINCWDLNGNRVNDNSEDVNNDNDWDAYDCQGSSQFVANSAPEVDAGTDQNIVGNLTSGGGGLGIPSFWILSCSFPLDGSVTDDVFTGYLAHEWASSISFLSIEQPDELSTNGLIVTQQPGVLSPIAVSGIATLTGDDGIIAVSESITLTCNPPA